MAFQSAPTQTIMNPQKAAQPMASVSGSGPGPTVPTLGHTVQAAPQPQAVNVGGSSGYAIN